MFKKILIANRGEIALRVICACKELGIKAVAIYSEADRNSLHVRFADEAICIGPPRLADSYLNIPAVISAAEIANVDAIHPGYGLLSENANFAEVCRACGIKFIGPPPEVTRLMGEKEKARAAMKKVGVPILPGSDGIVQSADEALEWASSIGFPVIVKASAGGGGRGMRIIRSADELPNHVPRGAIGGGRRVRQRRSLHGEVHRAAAAHRVPGAGRRARQRDQPGRARVQHPAPPSEAGGRGAVGDGDAGVARPDWRHPGEVAGEIGYMNAGTIEFLMDEDRSLHFIEMNTRIQVEHPVTEMTTDVDLVKSQILIAAGAKLDEVISTIRCTSADMRSSAASTPSIRSGSRRRRERSRRCNLPGGTGVRVDTAAYAEGVIPPYYDSLIAKLCARGRDRDEAISRMAAGAGYVRGGGHPHQHSAAQADHGGCGLPRGQL